MSAENDGFEMPSDELIKRICLDVNNYAVKRCEEEELQWHDAFIVVATLCDAMETYVGMCELLGPKAMGRIGKALMKLNAEELIEEANRAMKGE